MNTGHMEFAVIEQQLLVGNEAEQDWLRWYRQAEQLLGGNLDGEGEENGYSIDEAYDFFCTKKSPWEYITLVRARPNFELRSV